MCCTGLNIQGVEGDICMGSCREYVGFRAWEVGFSV